MIQVKTLIPDPLPAEVVELIDRRKRLGLDNFDEVWEGVYHVAPMARFGHARLDQQLAVLLEPVARRAGLQVSGAFNLGDPDNFRVPDRGIHRGDPDPGTVYLPSAAVVIEIVSPGDETYEKVPFYAAHQVEELWIVDPAERAVQIRALMGDGYELTERSGLLELTSGQIRAGLGWS